MHSRRVGLAVALWGCALSLACGQESMTKLSYAAEISLRQARLLLQQNDLNNAVLMVETSLAEGRSNHEYVQAALEIYGRQLRRYQDEGKVAQAAGIWEKIHALGGSAEPQGASYTAIPTAKQDAPRPSTAASRLQAAEQAFEKRDYAQARQLFQAASDRQETFSADAKNRFAYCRLHAVATRLNDTHGQVGDERPQLEREVRAALELAPRLEFGKELLDRLRVQPQVITTSIRHLDQKEGGWSVCASTHFRAFHADPRLAEQVLQIAETTRAAVCRKWLGHDVDWTQPCLIYVHPTADSYHRQSGMQATAPGHSDYDADKTDASIIHVRRVFVRADHAHMLTAILPHEVTHVVLNGQFGRKLLPRWADEGMAVLSEPFARIAMHLEPLPQAYQDHRALGLSEILAVENYPQDRSKVASFYGQSVCLVEYLTTLRGPQAFVAFMKDANAQGDAAALQKHYGLSVQDLETKLRNWIVTDHMPTLLRPDVMAGGR